MTPNPSVATEEVAVMGCGLMGAALARALVRHGHSVVAWNRTHERAAALASDGVVALRDVAAAADRARVVILCLNDYEATHSVLTQVDDWRGRVVINLTSGTPGEAQAAGQWFGERDVPYLDGTIFCYPEDIGGQEALLAYAGASSTWHAVRPLLESLGPAPLHVGADIRAANILLMGGSMFYLPAMVACTEMATYLHGQGISPEFGLRVMRMFAHNLVTATGEIQTAVANGNHRSDRATIDTYAHVDQPIADELAQAGQRAPVVTAAARLLSDGQAAGMGGLGPSALSDLLTEASHRGEPVVKKPVGAGAPSALSSP